MRQFATNVKNLVGICKRENYRRSLSMITNKDLNYRNYQLDIIFKNSRNTWKHGEVTIKQEQANSW